jgi:hypothetical protein
MTKTFTKGERVLVTRPIRCGNNTPCCDCHTGPFFYMEWTGRHHGIRMPATCTNEKPGTCFWFGDDDVEPYIDHI